MMEQIICKICRTIQNNDGTNCKICKTIRIMMEQIVRSVKLLE